MLEELPSEIVKEVPNEVPPEVPKETPKEEVKKKKKRKLVSNLSESPFSYSMSTCRKATRDGFIHASYVPVLFWFLDPAKGNPFSNEKILFVIVNFLCVVLILGLAFTISTTPPRYWTLVEGGYTLEQYRKKAEQENLIRIQTEYQRQNRLNCEPSIAPIEPEENKCKYNPLSFSAPEDQKKYEEQEEQRKLEANDPTDKSEGSLWYWENAVEEVKEEDPDEEPKPIPKNPLLESFRFAVGFVIGCFVGAALANALLNLSAIPPCPYHLHFTRTPIEGVHGAHNSFKSKREMEEVQSK